MVAVVVVVVGSDIERKRKKTRVGWWAWVGSALMFKICGPYRWIIAKPKWHVASQKNTREYSPMDPSFVAASGFSSLCWGPLFLNRKPFRWSLPFFWQFFLLFCFFTHMVCLPQPFILGSRILRCKSTKFLSNYLKIWFHSIYF